MADNRSVTSGNTGTWTAATDNIGGTEYQRVKVTPGPDGTVRGDVDGRLVDGSADSVALFVDDRELKARIQVAPTIDTAVYASGDSLGGEMAFAGAVRATGGTGEIRKVVVWDQGNQKAQIDLVFFDRALSVTPTNNTAIDIPDADAQYCLGHLTVYTTDYVSFADNAEATRREAFEVRCNATTLYCYAVVRGTPTYAAATDIIVTLTIHQD